MNVLLVEGDPILVEELQSGLPDFRFVACRNPDLAVSLVKAERFDVCLLDLVFPNSLDAVSTVVRANPEVPVVVATTLESDMWRGAFARGAQDFVYKPIDFVELAKAINKAVARRDTSAKFAPLAATIQQMRDVGSEYRGDSKKIAVKK